MRCSCCSKEITQEIIDSQPLQIRYTATNLIPTLCNECYESHIKLLNYIHGKEETENE